MDEVKKAKKGPLPSMMIMAGVAAILLFLMFSCAIIAMIYLYTAPSGAVTPPGGTGSGETGNGSQGTGSGNGSITLNTSSSNISAEDMSLWASIDTGNVQTACLVRAKDEAGSSADMVYSCTCNESAATLVKQYDCTIRTADPFTRYFANIRCSLADRSCAVETNYGTSNVTFSELRSYYSDSGG
jgi:hypothetical protein